MGDRLTTGVSSSLSSPSHFDLTTTGFLFTAGGGADAVLGAAFVGAGLVDLPFTEGSLSDSSTHQKKKKHW